MRVLLSAYACEPGKGSEPGVGWNWAIELAKLGHEVDVITRSNNRSSIDEALTDSPVSGLRFHYYDLPAWAKWWKRGRRGYHFYYSLWQRGVYSTAKRLTQSAKFDLVHHVTFGVLRQPSLLGRLGLPLILGPLGGGEMTPRSLRNSFPRKRRLQEAARLTSNLLAYWNPSVRGMLNDATIVFCKTAETLAALPPAYRHRARVQGEIGLNPGLIKKEILTEGYGANFLYAGSLVYWKGLHLALRAFSELKRERPDATFTIIGNGPDELWFKGLAGTLGVVEAVLWLGWVPREKLWTLYASHVAFVYPSLHDSSGNVVYEALSQALPVICLDTGGPGAIVPAACGIKVPVEDRSEAEIVTDLARAMRYIADRPDVRAQMAQSALDAARTLTWKNVVARAYDQIQDALGLGTS